MLPDTSTITRYIHVQEIAAANVRKLWLNWEIYFYHKTGTGLVV